MVWVNGKQNLERENFAPESRLSIAQISHLPKNGRETLNRVSKMAFKKLNTNFPLKHFVLKQRTTFSEITLLPLEVPEMSFSFNFPTGFSGNYL